MKPSEPSTPQPGAAWRSPVALVLTGLALGIVVEVLFDGRPIGISALIWAGLCVAATLGMAALERVRPSMENYWLIPPILFFAGMLALRLEPLTVLLDLGLLLALLALWVRVFRAGGLLRSGWLDLGIAVGWVPLESWIRPWPILGVATRQVAGEKASRSRWLALARGLLLAIPAVVVLAALLAAADVVFSDYVDEILRWLRIEKIVEYLGRTLVVVLSGLFLLGAMAAALRHPGERKYFGEDKPLVAPFLGFTESAVVLCAVNLLFTAFVAIQFTYLFGGHANITAAGYTYAEYARRGFGELVAVSFLTLALILGLSAVGRRETRRQQTAFFGLSGALVVLIGVILASALMRLLLYEDAYGFTRLRTYTHVAILWMGVLFLVFLALLIAGRLRAFAPAALAAAIGFAATLSLLNVDVFIVGRNAARLDESGAVDVSYLASLSNDAVPALVDLAAVVPEDERQALLGQLACRARQVEERGAGLAWPSYHLSHAAAGRALHAIEADLEAYPLTWQAWDDEYPSYGRWVVEVAGEAQDCVTWMAD